MGWFWRWLARRRRVEGDIFQQGWSWQLQPGIAAVHLQAWRLRLTVEGRRWPEGDVWVSWRAIWASRANLRKRKGTL